MEIMLLDDRLIRRNFLQAMRDSVGMYSRKLLDKSMAWSDLRPTRLWPPKSLMRFPAKYNSSKDSRELKAPSLIFSIWLLDRLRCIKWSKFVGKEFSRISWIAFEPRFKKSKFDNPLTAPTGTNDSSLPSKSRFCWCFFCRWRRRSKRRQLMLVHVVFKEAEQEAYQEDTVGWPSPRMRSFQESKETMKEREKKRKGENEREVSDDSHETC